MVVMKFGGSSVGNALRIQKVADIIVKSKEKHKEIVVVVSAISSVTDILIKCATLASDHKRKQLAKNFSLLKKIHIKTVSNLAIAKDSQKELVEIVNSYLMRLDDLLEGIYTLGEVTKRGMDQVCSFGERLSIHLLAYTIENLGVKAEAIEASDLIVTDNVFGGATPDLKMTRVRTKLKLQSLIKENTIPVVTGFIGADSKGVITTFGRGGSDYTATIIGYALNAKEVWIWTDVDGVMTADPKIVKNARTLNQISYNEAVELSYFGAKVLHPNTIIPASINNIPIIIKNTFNPSFKGTKITKEKDGNARGVKAITTIKDLSLVTLQGKGMLGVPGTAARLFSSVASKDINVLFISQASSEHSITFVVKRNDGEETQDIIKKTFQIEFINKTIDKVYVEDDIAIVAVVGEGMKGTPGIAGKIFSALGRGKVNVIAIAQGSSELNISFVIKESDIIYAVRRIHRAFNLGRK